MKFFTSKETKKIIESNSRIVYLYGSNMGYSNFGDIIQLKNEVAYHKMVTGFEPIVFLRLQAPFGYKAHESNRSWYDLEHIVYIDKELTCPTGLVEVIGSKVKHPLHVYGGGFLNSFWGVEMLSEIVSILKAFHVTDYIFSGQQISESMAKELKKALHENPPALFGLRDFISVEYLEKAAPELNGRYSFDDVTETLLEWSHQKRGLKNKAKSYLSSSILWHFNTTGYVSENGDDLKIKIECAHTRYPNKTCTIAQSYNDKTGGSKDSLQTIIEMENDFPYTSYKVVNLAQMALQMIPHKHVYPNIVDLLTGVDMAITSSYHTAMLTNYLGIPSFLMAANDYYKQKQKGLGFLDSYDDFLANPKNGLKDFSIELEKRKEWLRIQTMFFENIE